MSELELIRGDTEVLSLVFTDENDDPYDITGGTVFFTIKDNMDNCDNDDNALIQKDQSSHTDPANGLTEIELTATETRTLIQGNYKADFQFVGSDSKVKSTKKIKITVLDDTTKRTS
jgi:hypothetical protein